MTIRAKLTLQLAGIMTIILILFSLVVYYFTSLYRQDEIYKRIERRALIIAEYVLEADEVTVQAREQSQIKYYQVLPSEVVRVYKTSGELVFSDGDGVLKANMALLGQVQKKKTVRYEREDRQVVGVYYSDNEGEFIVFASSIDAYSLRKLRHLKVILIVGLFGSLVVVTLASWLFSKQALQSITKVVSEVEKINASGLHMRLSNAHGKDEISNLAQTFNKMLDRLEMAFEMQRTFVSNASHELRTPLTAMIGELEVALMKDREPKEYQRVLASILEDARLLAELSNGLLQIAQASIDASKIKKTYLRFDELVWLARDQALRRQPNATIDIEFFNFPDDEDRLVVKGNEALLLIAIVNIIENAIKFSPSGESILGLIYIKNYTVELRIKDKGLGIAPEDLKHVFVPFFRAENVRNITGHGIGLPLAERILKLHKGTISINSKINQGTEVIVSLPQAYGFIPI